MVASLTPPSPLGLHACCGPCSLAPVRLLRAAGFEPVIIHCNPNIAPAGEYARRLETLRGWAAGVGVTVDELAMDHERWVEAVGAPFEARIAEGVDGEMARRERCRACYRLRFEAAAQRCRELNLPGLSTTLSVSPYQYTDVIAEELDRAAALENLTAHFEDFRPAYREASREATELGLYRQNYCGCEYSAVEAERERAARRQAQAERRAARRPQLEAEAEARRERARKRQAYERERARRREVRRALRGLR